METPLISVLLPVYKHEAYLMDAVQSIINQTYRNWELLILNDDPNIVIHEYKDFDNSDRIRTFDTFENKGKWYRINEGLQIARGQYIAFQDADDISIPQRLEQSLDYIEGYDFLYGDAISLLSNGLREYSRPCFDDIKNKPIGNQGSYFFKKNAPKYPEIGRGDDWLFVAKCLEAGMRLVYLPLPLYYYRDYTGNFRKNSNRLKRYLSNRRLKKLVAEITKS